MTDAMRLENAFERKHMMNGLCLICAKVRKDLAGDAVQKTLILICTFINHAKFQPKSSRSRLADKHTQLSRACRSSLEKLHETACFINSLLHVHGHLRKVTPNVFSGDKNFGSKNFPHTILQTRARTREIANAAMRTFCFILPLIYWEMCHSKQTIYGIT